MPYKYKSEIDVITVMYSKLSDLPIELMRPVLKTVSAQNNAWTTLRRNGSKGTSVSLLHHHCSSFLAAFQILVLHI